MENVMQDAQMDMHQELEFVEDVILQNAQNVILMSIFVEDAKLLQNYMEIFVFQIAHQEDTILKEENAKNAQFSVINAIIKENVYNAEKDSLFKKVSA
jgi:hypothetical protein